MKMTPLTRAEKYAQNWSSLSFYRAILCPSPEPLRFRVQRAFTNPVIAECDWSGRLKIKKVLRLSQEETRALSQWLVYVFIEEAP